MTSTQCTDDIEFAGFYVPLWRQRLQKTQDVLLQHSCKSIIDVGCGEGKLISFLKMSPYFERFVGVDVDDAALRLALSNTTLLFGDYVLPRPRGLSIQLLQGSALTLDERFCGMDAVTSIEVIEHLQPEHVAAFTRVLFALQARTVIVSTPNADFNVFLNLPAGRFRHWDHKFEWTRAEFRDWCHSAASQFGYSFVIMGLGDSPAGRADVGGCTQMAVFTRNADAAAAAAAAVSGASSTALTCDAVQQHADDIPRATWCEIGAHHIEPPAAVRIRADRDNSDTDSQDGQDPCDGEQRDRQRSRSRSCSSNSSGSSNGSADEHTCDAAQKQQDAR